MEDSKDEGTTKSNSKTRDCKGCSRKLRGWGSRRAELKEGSRSSKIESTEKFVTHG